LLQRKILSGKTPEWELDPYKADAEWKKELAAKKFSQFEDRFQFPLAMSVICIVLAFIIPERRKTRNTLADFIEQDDKK
jgi:hypothetical protein